MFLNNRHLSNKLFFFADLNCLFTNRDIFWNLSFIFFGRSDIDCYEVRSFAQSDLLIFSLYFFNKINLCQAYESRTLHTLLDGNLFRLWVIKHGCERDSGVNSKSLSVCSISARWTGINSSWISAIHYLIGFAEELENRFRWLILQI